MHSVAVTGHRPFLLGLPEIDDRILFDLAKEWLSMQEVSEVVSGIADGWDTTVAEAALALELPLIAAIAYPLDVAQMPEEPRERYLALLDGAAVVNETHTEKVKGIFTKRDRWVLERGDLVLAMSSGVKGGTERAIKTAIELGKPIVNLWDRYFDILTPEQQTLVAQRLDSANKKHKK